MPERVDLGPCSAIRHEGDPDRCAVVLPGMIYPTRAPVLWFAREAVMAAGWSALEILGEPGLHPEPVAWETEATEAALRVVAEVQVLVIGKSLATLQAAMVGDRGLPAAWLTPALDQPEMAEGLGKARRPTLVLGGSADPMWVPSAIPENPSLEVVEIPGVDHALQIAGDVSASLTALGQMADAVRQLAGRL